MILINNQWEQVESLEDVSRIVKENLSEELAEKINKLSGIVDIQELEEKLNKEKERIKKELIMMTDTVQRDTEEKFKYKMVDLDIALEIIEHSIILKEGEKLIMPRPRTLEENINDFCKLHKIKIIEKKETILMDEKEIKERIKEINKQRDKLYNERDKLQKIIDNNKKKEIINESIM